MTTYLLCKTLIENETRKGTLDKEDITFKLDVFLLNNRITQENYEELINLMD